MAHIYGFKTGVISGPEIPLDSLRRTTIFGGAFVPTTQGLLYTNGPHLDKNLYELRGDSIQSLEWFELDEKLSGDSGYYPTTIPLPTELEVTCI